MNHRDFNVLLEARLQRTRDVLAAKGKEYSTDDDKLHNFKEAARLDGTNQATALKGMLLKHWISIQDLVTDYALGNRARLHLADEKIGDAINYLILLEAVLKE